MNRLAPILLLLLLVTGFVRAQNAFDSRYANLVVLQNKSVQREIKLTEDQRKRMNVHADRFNAQMERLAQTIQASGKEPTEAQQKQIAAARESLARGVLGVLQPAQLARLREISIQQLGPGIIIDGPIAQRIGLTNEQRKRIQTIVERHAKRASDAMDAEARKRFADLQKRTPKNDAERRQLQEEAMKREQQMMVQMGPRMIAMRAQAAREVEAVLNAKQRTAWRALLGRPFTIRPDA